MKTRQGLFETPIYVLGEVCMGKQCHGETKQLKGKAGSNAARQNT